MVIGQANHLLNKRGRLILGWFGVGLIFAHSRNAASARFRPYGICVCLCESNAMSRRSMAAIDSHTAISSPPRVRIVVYDSVRVRVGRTLTESYTTIRT